ncbi:nitrogen permease regulator family [Cryptosporidium sp. chipmunk genotype I]|uniref:nitrogen permease regulator family n=1 Tax=Cryptosporidium sp. chipmunk genotype I TaxID=1280935 RepID=UPI00351A0D34|nr:nitrogen permease regulator family [Cryptosporidium sp. chipmunk genotype I]
MNTHFLLWPKIEAIIFCKFDEELGPIVLCSSPSDMFGSEKSQFYSIITKYLLPDIHFAGKTISFVMGNKWKAIGVPIFIEGSQYPRNSFQFTVCIIVEKKPYDFYQEIYSRHIARILGSAFKLLEEDCGILYYYCTYTENLPDLLRKVTNNNNGISSFPKNILEVIENVRSQLNQKHQVFVEFGNASILNFRIRRPPFNIIINPEDIPFPSEKKMISDINHIGLDFSLIKILPYINGINTSFEISKYCSLPIKDVIVCLEHLVLYGLISMIDMISLENRYRFIGGEDEHGLYRKLCNECINAGNVLSFTKKYYGELRKYKIKSIYKFIAAGVVSKKITRLHEIPIIFIDSKEVSGIEKELLQLCNGSNTLDHIQILFGFNTKSEIIRFISNVFNNSSIYWAYL